VARSFSKVAVKGSAEVNLAVECCRSNFIPAGTRTNAKLDGVEWNCFLGLVRFHRIQGLAWSCLATEAIPAEVAGALAEDARTIAARNLLAIAASRDLLRQFESAGVPLLFLKGPTLGALAYGNPALKSAIDVDLLIDLEDLSRASRLLRDGGFRLTAPKESREDHVLRSWHEVWKESVWAKDSPPLQIDLHTRTADNRRLIRSIDVNSPRQIVHVGNGIRLPTLARDELFAYLAVHGASSAWFRLKWISDFAGMLHACGAEELERLYRRSQELGSGRSAGQGLLLAHHLFGTLDDAPALLNELRHDRKCFWLYRTAFRQLTSDCLEPTERPWGTLPIHLSQFALLPGPGFQFNELWRQARQKLTRAI
jgi:hypothetical protein